METFLAILMELGLYVGLPVAIAFAVGGVVVLSSRRATRTRRARSAAAEGEVPRGGV